MKIGILGAAGTLGRRLSLDLAETPGISKVLLFDANPRVTGLVDVLPFEKARAFVVEDDAEFSEGLAECDVVVGDGGVSPEREHQIASMCISSGVPYLSAACHPDNYELLTTLDEAARNAGVMLLVGAAWPTAFCSVLASAASRELSHVEEIKVSWVISVVGGAPEDALQKAMRALGGHAPVFTDGAWARRPAGEAAEQVFFPEPVGWATVHLVSAIEPLTLPRSNDGLTRVVAKGGIREGWVARASRRFSSIGRLAKPATRDNFLDFARPLMNVTARLAGTSGGWSAARVDVRGAKNGAVESVAFGVVDQFPNLYSACLVTCAVMSSRGEIKGAGVVTPDAAIDAKAFVAGLDHRGVGIARLERS